MKKHKVALIGLGMAIKPHVASLIDLQERVEVAAAYAPSAKRREQFAATYPFPVADSLDAVFADKSIDSVIILTPPWTHDELTRQAANAGKHVLLEKPLDVNAERAAGLVEFCAQKKVTLACVFQHRFRPASLKLKSLLDDDVLGEILSASASIPWWRSAEYFGQPGRGMIERDGGGVLLTQAIHTLDLLLHLMGEAPASVFALADNSGLRQIDTEDRVAGVMRWHNGASGVIDANTLFFPGYPEQIRIAGTQGSAILEVDNLTVLLKGGQEIKYEGSVAGGSSNDPMAFSHTYHRALIEEFLNAIDESREPSNSGASALRVHRLIDGLMLSSKNRAMVDL